eukprot:m.215777 g.215777  ORF g.215777 m.215777 type:complete len:102 (-) comp16978_c0_seq21:100-405(-)
MVKLKDIHYSYIVIQHCRELHIDRVTSFPQIATRELPFVELPSVHHVRQAIIKGERPALKSSCPVMFGKLMHECWADDRKARPKFYEIRARLLHGVDESAV